MTKFRAKHKAHAFLGAAFVLLIALMFTACKQPASAEKPEPPAPLAPPKHAVTFSVEGTPPNGTLKAILGTSEITSGDKVEEGKWVIFTAKADEGYRVKEWKLDGNAIKGHKSNTYPHKVTKPAAITVSFEPYSVKLTLSPDKNTLKVKAKTKDGSAIKVEGCTVTELTSDMETTLTAIGTKVTLIGDIIELDCSGEKTPGGNRPLITLDASGCTALQKLDCRYNFITELDVQGLTALQELYCNSNRLTVLDVHGLTKLEKLYCNTNRLTALNVLGCTALKELICNGNGLITLNVSGCTVLQKFNCSRNQLSTLDVSGLTALQKLDCESNQLSTLDVQGLTELQQLYCDSNQLSSLNVQGCTALKSLTCYKNKLNADVFTKLFNDLPTREASDGAKAMLYVQGAAYNPQTNDDNCTDFTQPESLKKAFEDAKNVKLWKLQKRSAVGFPSDI